MKALIVHLPPIPWTSSIFGLFISLDIFNNENCQVKVVDPNVNSLICTWKISAAEMGKKL